MYEFKTTSIFRRVVALVVCFCLFACAAVPAFAFPVILPGADPVSIGWSLATSAYLSAIGYGATDEDDLGILTDGLLDEGITAGFANADGTLSVAPSDADGVYFISEQFCEWYNEQLAINGFFLNSSFRSEPGLIVYNQPFTAEPYSVYQFIGQVAGGLDPSFSDWWASQAGNWFSPLSNAVFGCLTVDAYGVANVRAILPQSDIVDAYGGTNEFHVELYNGLDIIRCDAVGTSEGDFEDVLFKVAYFTRSGDSFNSGYSTVSNIDITSLASTNSSLVPFDGYRSILFGTFGTWSIDEYGFIPPSSPPGIGESMASAYPDWYSGASGGALPLTVPSTVSEAVNQSPEVAQGAVDSTAQINYNGRLNTIIDILRLFLNSFISQIGSLAATVVAAADALGIDIAEWGQNIVDSVDTFKAAFVSGFNQWMQRLYQAFGTVKTAVDTMSTAVVDAVDNAWWQVNQKIGVLYDYLSDIYNELANGISVAVGSIWQWTGEFFGSLTNTLSSFWGNTIDTLKDWYDAFIEFINSFFANLRAALEGVIAPVLEGILALPGYIMQLPDYVAAWFGRAKDIIAEGFGFSSIWHYVVSWIGCISGFVGVVLGIWGKLPYCMVVPVYACVVLTIVFGLYRRFIR